MHLNEELTFSINQEEKETAVRIRLPEFSEILEETVEN